MTGSVSPKHVTSFEQAQPRIKAKLRNRRLAEMEAEYLRRLRDRANVRRWQEFQLEVLRSIPEPESNQQQTETAAP